MRYFLLIFALLIACSDEKEPCYNSRVTISDALPIQFWPVDCDTYNEKALCGVHKKCWYQPWQCDDELKVQFTNIEVDQEFTLGFNDVDGLIGSVPFNKTEIFETENEIQFSNNDFEFNIIDWDNYSSAPGSSAGWSWDSGAAYADGSGGGLVNTYQLAQQRIDLGAGGYAKYPAGEYTFRIVIDNQSTTTPAPLSEGLVIRGVDTLGGSADVGSGGTIARGGGQTEYLFSFTTTQAWNYFTIAINKQGVGTSGHVKVYVHSFEILSNPLDYSTSLYNTSIIPTEEGLCDKQVNFEIINEASPETIVAKSDCIDIRDTHDCTLLIDYSNNINLFGLIYEADVSPELSFLTRVPAIFFHEKFPTEDQAIELTTGIQKTSGFLKSQRLFETDYIPYYMHKKIQLILMHQNILIDNLYWLKEEAYELTEGDRRWPVKKAKVYLTSRDDVNRATL